MHRVPLLVLVLILATGCANTPREAGEAPIHFHLVCLAGTDGKSLGCDRAERLNHFTAWVSDGLSRPASTFTIWAVGLTSQRSSLVFAACVPARWGSSVWKAKASFLAQAREGVGGSQSGLSVPERCAPPGPNNPATQRLAVSASASHIPDDVWQHVAVGSAAPPLHLAVVCDRSPSTNGVACTPSAVLSAFDRWVLKGLLRPGASLSVEMVGSATHFLSALFMLTVPDTPLGERVAFALGGREDLSRLLTDSSETYTSTIAEALSAAVSRLRERRGHYELLLLSDLLQITPGGFNFERALPTPEEFIAWLKRAGLGANLGDIPILACGVHTGQALAGTAPYTAAYAKRLGTLWESVLRAMGAPEVKLFSSCAAGFAA
jgi:hypothetical protein